MKHRLWLELALGIILIDLCIWWDQAPADKPSISTHFAPIGLGLAICSVIIAVYGHMRRRPKHPTDTFALPTGCIFTCIGAIGLIINPGPLDCFLIATGGLIVYAGNRQQLPSTAVNAIASLCNGIGATLRSSICDLHYLPRLWTQSPSPKPHFIRGVLQWSIPLFITLLFAALFGLANPVIEQQWVAIEKMDQQF